MNYYRLNSNNNFMHLKNYTQLMYQGIKWNELNEEINLQFT